LCPSYPTGSNLSNLQEWLSMVRNRWEPGPDPDPEPSTDDAPHGHQVAPAVGLAFVNTLEHDRGRTQERLRTVGQALRWLHDHRLLHLETYRERKEAWEADPEAGERALERIHRMRRAMRELMDATVDGRAPDRRELEAVNRALRTPYTYVLVPAADGVSLDHRHEGDPIEGALARLVESLAREVSQGRPERLRVCAEPSCRWVFLDTSRSGRRKWCDMSTCGNRAKVARHRDRRRGAGTDPEPAAPDAGAAS